MFYLKKRTSNNRMFKIIIIIIITLFYTAPLKITSQGGWFKVNLCFVNLSQSKKLSTDIPLSLDFLTPAFTQWIKGKKALCNLHIDLELAQG